jgi:superfamily II DNA/RNA helicase
MSFEELGLSAEVLAAVRDAGYTSPTPIQEKGIPQVLAGRDLIGIAQTGTGKTASFCLPMICKLSRGRARARMPRSLILEPTRELAAQVVEEFEKLGKNHKLTVGLLIGGVSYGDQDLKLDRGVDVLIATPGRMLDHFERGKLLLNGIEILVIDEADRMLDMGFIPDVERICKLIPFTRQTLFYSATMPPEIQKLTNAFLQNPVRIEVTPQATAAETVTQSVCMVGDKEKREALRRLIKREGVKNAIIFCNRKRDVATLYRALERSGFSVAALHGDMDQRARTLTLDSFRKGEIMLLVASDVAARGLDIPEVSHIFNFDVPMHAEDYIHRIGRTGRAGRSGRADYPLRISRGIKTRDVLGDRPGKELDILGQIADVAPKRLLAPLVERRAVETDLAARRLPDADEKPGQRRFSSRARPDDANTLAGLERETYVGEDEPVATGRGGTQHLDLKGPARGRKL